MSRPVEQEGSVKFLQFHQPTLADGDYEITVTQSVNITDHSKIDPFIATRYFTVAGERFELKPTDVHGVFPPEANLGDHSNVLPHLILNRSTLPWERTAESYAEGEKEQVTGVPWLALLVFDEEDKPRPKTLTAHELETAPAAGQPRFPKIVLESAQRPEDVLTVIDVPCRVLKAIMPAVDELKLLAHVRSGTIADENPTRNELAVIIANRLPQPGKTSTAHLVSLERRFAKGLDEGEPRKYGFNYQGATGDDLIRLVSLKSWSFACVDQKKDFKQLLLGLKTTPSTLRLPGDSKTANNLILKGYVLLPHYFRHGDQTASCFHGPLIPGKNTSAGMELPARTTDELVRYDPALSMFDVSYAAAWELGRLLALKDKAFSTSLYQWKREHAQHLVQDEQRLVHLPFQKETPADIPSDISVWFEKLRKLDGVPFNYLVPDERMLPAESIRFFRVDQVWVDCLADGAFSIGRVASSHYETDKSHGEDSPAAGDDDVVTGFFLRSEVVSGWPGLIVDAFSDYEGDSRLTCLRMERLAAGVLMCLIEGDVVRVDMHLKPETLHFGLHSAAGVFSKKLRDSKGAALKEKIELNNQHWRRASQRTLNISTLAQSMKDKLKLTSSLTSAQFALQMVEGVEKIIFVATKPEVGSA